MSYECTHTYFSNSMSTFLLALIRRWWWWWWYPGNFQSDCLCIFFFEKKQTKEWKKLFIWIFSITMNLYLFFLCLHTRIHTIHIVLWSDMILHEQHYCVGDERQTLIHPKLSFFPFVFCRSRHMIDSDKCITQRNWRFIFVMVSNLYFQSHSI